MQVVGTTTLAQGKLELEKLINEIKLHNLDWNEAETRFQIINKLIVKCLGWPDHVVRLEQPQGRQYSDYELGIPRQVIWEAKRENKTFQLPANGSNKIIRDLASIIQLDKEIEDAVYQVQGYCIRRGVDLAVVCNGGQLLAFLASRNDGIEPLKAHCLIIDGYEQMIKEFPIIWQLLSPDGVMERKLFRYLKVGEDRGLPEKMSTYLSEYPKHRFQSDLQHSLRTLSELLLTDIIEQETIEKQFYEECYSESGALSQHALVSKGMLAARYAALFKANEKGPNVVPAKDKSGNIGITSEVIAASMLTRPIVLIGDVGVGKTSFLKHLMYVGAYEEFKNSLYIYINLGSRGALSSSLTEFVLSEIENELYRKYNVDIRESGFVRGVYDLDIQRFDKGLEGEYKTSNPERYRDELFAYLKKKKENLDQHLRDSINHIAKARKQQVIIFLDNADQRVTEIQQEAFIIAQNLAKEWKCAVFIAVRPHTFFVSKKTGTFTAYPPRIFTISPPRVDSVVEKRLKFALGIAEGKIKLHDFENISLNLGNIALFIKAFIYSLNTNEHLIEFLSNITGGNIRECMDFVTKFIGSPNVDAEKIILTMENQGRYTVPVHEFWKAALLGEYSYYHPPSSMALNLFDIRLPNVNEHFLIPMILGYLNSDGNFKSKEGFVALNTIISEMQNWGFSPSSTEDAVRRVTNKKLIETSQRVTFDEGDGSFYEDEMPDSFRINTIGAYHLKRWISEFAFLDAMAVDTPILYDEIKDAIRTKVNSLTIRDRYDRAIHFRSYLSKAWHDSSLKPTYFDWTQVLESGNPSFERVRQACENGKNSEKY